MKHRIKNVLGVVMTIVVTLSVVYFLGPKTDYAQVDGKITLTDISLETLDSQIMMENSALANLRLECETSIIWHNDSVQCTEYAVVFLHGFSACPFEGNPIVQDFAKEFGCNLYLQRLPDHGLDDAESFKDLTPEMWVEAAKKAINIGANIGKKVILMSSSTGGTLSTFLTANNPDLIAAQFLYSPNFAIENPAAFLLNNQWGFQILKQIEGGKYHHIQDMSTASKPYWTTTYRIEGIVALQELIEQTMKPSVFEAIKSPVFLGYYYKNETEKDNVVSIDAMKDFYNQIQTPKEQKMIVPFANVGGHVITNKYQKGGLEEVRAATFDFARKVVFK